MLQRWKIPFPPARWTISASFLPSEREVSTSLSPASSSFPWRPAAWCTRLGTIWSRRALLDTATLPKQTHRNGIPLAFFNFDDEYGNERLLGSQESYILAWSSSRGPQKKKTKSKNTCGLLNVGKHFRLAFDMSQLLVLGKVEYGGGPIFKVVLECKKRCSQPFLIYIYGIQCDFMPKSCWKHSNFENR